MLSEKLEVLAPVKNEEALFVHMWAIQRINDLKALTQASPAANHLPELDLRAHLLEEDEINDFGHIDASVHHIDRHGDNRQRLDLKIIDYGVRIIIRMQHRLYILSREIWI